MTKKRSFADLRSRIALETQDEVSAETIRISDETASSEQSLETLAPLKVLALGNPALDVIAQLRAKG